ncbi:MAG: hypothetical protein AAGA03_09665, partial [Planctomycetota bacterium]
MHQLDIDEISNLRLTIDNLSPGKVWVDAIELHDRFASAAERNSLQNLAFLAAQGFRDGDLNATSRLLNNEWARYLLSVTPNSETAGAQPSQRESPPTGDITETNTTANTSEQEPGIARRIRQWLPRPLRF